MGGNFYEEFTKKIDVIFSFFSYYNGFDKSVINFYK